MSLSAIRHAEKALKYPTSLASFLKEGIGNKGSLLHEHGHRSPHEHRHLKEKRSFSDCSCKRRLYDQTNSEEKHKQAKANPGGGRQAEGAQHD